MIGPWLMVAEVADRARGRILELEARNAELTQALEFVASHVRVSYYGVRVVALATPLEGMLDEVKHPCSAIDLILKAAKAHAEAKEAAQ